VLGCGPVGLGSLLPPSDGAAASRPPLPCPHRTHQPPSYEGEWLAATYEGAGSETFAKGSTYRGHYSGGLRSGWGVCRCGACAGGGMQAACLAPRQAAEPHCFNPSIPPSPDPHPHPHPHITPLCHPLNPTPKPLRFYNGDYYEGRWERGVREGTGMQQCTDDSNYVGEYARGKRHGYGVYSFPNGDQYTGEYEEDLPQVVVVAVGGGGGG
jgi:hypothetical protein